MTTLTKQVFGSALIILCLSVLSVTAVFAQEQEESVPTSTEETTATADVLEEAEDIEPIDNLRDQREVIRTELNERRQELETRAASRTDAIRDEVESRKVELLERLQNRVLNLFDNMRERMEAAVWRLTHIANRLESRIEKLAQGGVDTGSAQVLIDDARGELAAAQALLGQDNEATVRGAVSSNEPRTQIQSIRELFVEAAQHIRNARQLLHDALREAQGGMSTSQEPDVSDDIVE